MPDLSTARATAVPPIALNAASQTTLIAAPPATRLLLRGGDAIATTGAVLGMALPTVPCRSAVSGARAALWLGPDEWLLIASEAETVTLETQLSTALAGVPHALVDISHRQTAVLIDGAAAATILNAGVPLDLALSAFPVGMVTRTIFEKTEIVLWRTAAESFRVEVWRSFAPYLVELLGIVRDEEVALRSAGLG
jgi:sarcosine oxidase subunit gamma